jgi:GR25 family glycosyltransferase involved in LPS biosynthesis
MMQKNVTFLIPIFNLLEDRLNNLKFILPFILNTGCKTILVEQVSTQESALKNLISEIVPEVNKKIFEHALYVNTSKVIHKTGMINSIVNTKIDTKYVWVNDVDFYMKFDSVLKQEWNAEFIQPYSVAKKLSKNDSHLLFAGKSINVDFSDKYTDYISLYGALSFIFDVQEFLKIGGMNETIYGWGCEDVELCKRVKSAYNIQNISMKGIHLYHPIEIEAPQKESVFDINTYFDKIYCINLDRRNDRWENVNKKFQDKKIKVERFRAIDAVDVDDEEFKNANPNGLHGIEASVNGIIENKSAMGCLLSHLSIIKDAKEKNYKRILIFEDDVIFSDDFDARIKSINELNWRLIYLGASQFSTNKLRLRNNFYLSENTYGTFAYAIDCDLYDTIIKKFTEKRKSADNYLLEVQSENYGDCYTFYPNIVISDVEDSNIRPACSMQDYANLVGWDLKRFTKKTKIKRILLLPDVREWAFDNIAKAIVKYNPYPDKINYDITYVKDILEKKIELKNSDWDLIFVMFEAEKIIPDGKNIVRGCYSAFWLERPEFSPEKLGHSFSNCKGAVFVNPELRRKISPFLTDKFPTSVIYDSSDENMFYPVEGIKNKQFTAVFVGNPNRRIKNFPDIQYICKQAGVALEVCSNVPSKYLIYEYNKADVCINFSTFEGGPQTFTESSLCGTPMLIRSTNELSKLIPCFKGETIEDFIDTLKFLKRNRDVCKQRGNEARNFVLNNLTYKHAAIKFANFFLELK